MIHSGLRKLIILIFVSIACLSSLVSAEAKQTINHAIGVYISPKGLELFKNDLKTIIENNGFEIDQLTHEGTTINLEEMALEDMFSDDETKEVIGNIKNILTKYFIGLDFDKHRFQVDIKGIGFKADWNRLSLDFYKPEMNENEAPYDVLAYAWIEMSNLRIEINEITARDLNNKFIGDVGINGLSIIQPDSSEKLRIGLPVKIGKDAAGKFKLQVYKPVSNIENIKIEADFKTPLRIPKIEVLINGHSVLLNLEELENIIKEQQPKMLEKIQAQVQTLLEETVPELLTNKLNEAIKGGVSELSQITAPGAPESSQDEKLFWGMDLQEFNFAGDSLHLGLGAVVIDPTLKKDIKFPKNWSSQKYPNLETTKIESHDITLALNEGFFNRILQLSAHRKYFESMSLDSGEKLKLIGTPLVKFARDQRNEPAKLKIKIEYTVTGWKRIFVRNPIQIEMDLNLEFPINKETGVVKMIARGIDRDSVYLDKKYIRLFNSRVRKAVEETINDMQSDLDGYELADTIPVPTDLGGISLRIEDADVNENGYLMIYTDYADL